METNRSLANPYTIMFSKRRVQNALPLFNWQIACLLCTSILAPIALLIVIGCQRTEQEGEGNALKKTNNHSEKTDLSTTDENDFDQTSDQFISAIDQTPTGRGIAYLLNQQADDELWHSPNYGNLKDGAGISCMVLYAISHADKKYWSPHSDRLQRCVDALQTNVEKFGYVTNSDGADYSNYGSALLLLATRRLGLKLHQDQRFRLIEYLTNAQLDETEGFDSDNDDFGGWDLNGWMTGKRPTTGSNISVSATVIEALSIEYDELLQSARKKKFADDSSESKLLEKLSTTCLPRAKKWIMKCRNEDGGFFFHPEQKHLGNKAGWEDKKQTRAASYGSATADGLRSMLYLLAFLSATDPSSDFSESKKWTKYISEAATWIRKQPSHTVVPGFGKDEESWSQGLKYYYWMSLSYSTLIIDKDMVDVTARQQSIDKIIVSEQKDDGRWENPNARMREDDPLICTSFAIIALNWRTELDAEPAN